MVRKEIEKGIEDALKALGVIEAPFVVSVPEKGFGDYATNAALIAGKKLGVSPREAAESIVEKLTGKLPFIEKTEIAAPGFINFHLSPSFFADFLQELLEHPDAVGRGETFAGKKVLVEYTQPNPFKEFHIGHLMNNAIGESISRLIEWCGAEVKRANYQGDVGPHVAKCIWGLRKLSIDSPTAQEMGRAYVLGSEAYEGDPRAQEEINVINKKVYERSDIEINRLYDIGRRVSLEHFEEIYRKLGTSFDFYFFESETAPRGLALIRQHPSIFEESAGAIIFRGESYGLHTRVFVNKLGLPTYEAKDVGLAQLKKETYPFDLSLTVTAVEQDVYFKVIWKAVELVLPELTGKMMHRIHGLLRLTSGKMSSRKGNVITGESLLADMEESVREKMAGRSLSTAGNTTETVAVAGLKYAVLRQASGKDIVFDPEKSLSFEGDSGPYLQYAHVRAYALSRKAQEQGIVPTLSASHAVSAVERLLIHFPEAVERAAREFEPHHVTTYLTELASVFNSWYAQERIVEDTEEGRHKVAVTEVFRLTMERGLWLLGIKAPEEM